MLTAWLACAAPKPPDDGPTRPSASATPTPELPATAPPPSTSAPPAIAYEEVADACPPGLWPELRLVEIVPGNVDGWRDATGEIVDWIEIGEAAGSPFDPSGWTLDDGGPREPLPTGAVGDRLLVAASGKAADPLGPPPGEPHLGFRLDSVAETVSLRAPDGCVADAVSWSAVPADVALGRPADDPTEWAFFLQPTPGTPNTTESRPRFAAVPGLSPPSGLVADAVVVVDVPPGTVVRGTLDGREPDELSAPYVAPFAVDGTAGPVPVRVRAFEEGAWPSPIATSVIVEDATVFAAGLRVVHLTVHPDDFFDPETGIWTYGDPADYEPWYPYFGANFWEDWERPVHVDLFEPDGSVLLSQDAGIAIHGGYSRAFDQRGLRLLASSAWLDDDFDVRAFPDDALDRFTALVLHNGGDWCGTHLLDASSDPWFRDAVGRRVDVVDRQGWEPVEVWLNGAFWGLYQMRERLDGDWVGSHHDADADALDRLELGWTHNPNWEIEQGDAVAMAALN
jgi:hypothetical protein